MHCNSALISCLSHLAGKASLAGSLSPEYEKYIFFLLLQILFWFLPHIYFMFKWPVEMVWPGSVSGELVSMKSTSAGKFSGKSDGSKSSKLLGAH